MKAAFCIIYDSITNLLKYIWNNQESISNLSVMIISFLNFIFVIRIHSKDKKERHTERINNHNYEWYKMLGIEERVAKLNELNGDIINFINSKAFKNTKKRKSFINELNTRFYAEKNKYKYILGAIDKEKNIEITKLYNNFQSIYMTILTSSTVDNNMLFKLENIIYEIMQKFYNIGKSQINNKIYRRLL